jgi:hypothetical protein
MSKDNDKDDYEYDKNGNPVTNEEGFMVKKVLSPSTKAERSRVAKRKAMAEIRKKKNAGKKKASWQIPASPTR